MSTHNANADKSFRLHRCLDFLKDAGHFGATTWEIQQGTGSCAVHTDIHELRCNGYLISCDYEGMTQAHRRINRYRLIGRDPTHETHKP